MNLKALLAIAFIGMVLVSCDDTTEGIGNSLVKQNSVVISTDTFTVTSKSVIVDSVLSKNTIAYLGKVRDPETGVYVAGNSMIQFHTLPNLGLTDSINGKDHNGNIIADSCDIILFYDDFYGDSLRPMKLTVYELDHPMLENQNYYSNFDPKANGYIRTGNGIKKEQIYTLSDMNRTDSVKGSYRRIRIPLNDSYTDKAGITYNNYGSYLLQTYQKHPEYFSTGYNFIKNVVPGFYFENQGDLTGSMAYIHGSRINAYYHKGAKDSVRWASFDGTEEVLQTSKIINDNNSIRRLAAEQTCTHLRTPAGIFTELELPVNSILNGHEHDTINAVKLSLTRINNTLPAKVAFNAPSELLLLPKDSLHSFFEKGSLIDNKTSYLAFLNANTYTYYNISNLISAMGHSNKASANWNKVVLVPVTVTRTRVSTNSNETIITKIVHDMSLSGTRLVGGENNPNGDVKISVIYGKYE